MKTILHTATIDHPSGYIDLVALTAADLDRQISPYCREHWAKHFAEDEPIPESDDELIEQYFDQAGNAGIGDGEFCRRVEHELEIPGQPAIAPLPTFTFWCQESTGEGTIYINSLQAADLEAAQIAAVQECCDEWNVQGEEPNYTPENIHLLGIAAGDVEILHWQDISEA